MATIILDTSTDSSRFRVAAIRFAGSDVVSQPKYLGDRGEVVRARTLNFRVESGTKLGADPIAPSELEYWTQKQAFLLIPKDQRLRYSGQFVVARDGRIMDSDADLATLVNRFFSRFGDAPAYVTKIDGAIDFHIATPFFE